jgi:hypothetical protein
LACAFEMNSIKGITVTLYYPYLQAIGLGLIRSDVMLGCDAEEPEMALSDFKLRQVEVRIL